MPRVFVLFVLLTAALSQAKVTAISHPKQLTQAPIRTNVVPAAYRQVLQLPPVLVMPADDHPFVHEFYPPQPERHSQNTQSVTRR